VGNDLAEAEVLRGVVADAGDDVPADPAFAEVIEGRQASGEAERMLGHDRAGEGQAEVLGHADQRRAKRAGIIAGNLQAFLDVGVPGALVGRIDADDVGEKQGVEFALFEQRRQFGPGFELVEMHLRALGVAPQPVVDVGHNVHRKAVEN
jgi:hypothetical protein